MNDSLNKKLSLNEFKILSLIAQNGGSQTMRALAKQTGMSLGSVSAASHALQSQGLISKKSITFAGETALKPYKVDSAVILAAGTSSRFVPLSYDKPKALLPVKGEILIEREIRQLKEAGIDNIIVVAGYKKEMLFYLEDLYNVKIIINPFYLEKNNIETIWLARNHIANTYICCSDQYFVENPFHMYEYSSYIACGVAKDPIKGLFFSLGSKNSITDAVSGKRTGIYALGESYWNKDFSSAFLKLIESHRLKGDYDAFFWENLYADNIGHLPTVTIKENKLGCVYDFNCLDELRAFDNSYIDNLNSDILDNISRYFQCTKGEIQDFKTIKKGLTNTSFSFCVHGNRYVYRHPGEGANEIIDRHHEKICLEIAKKYGIDPSFLTMDEKAGWKISKFIADFHEPSYSDSADCSKVIATLKKLHSLPIKVGWEFDPWEGAMELEEKTCKSSPITMEGFQNLKKNIEKIYSSLLKDGYKKCFCHCDTYSPNWMITSDSTYLIDWEYGGMADPGVDVGYFLVDGEYDIKRAKEFIQEYCGDKYSEKAFAHFLGYAALISYYWFVWALYKESKGAVMGEALYRWYRMSKHYANSLLDKAYMA